MGGLISVIITTFGSPLYLRNAINSVLNQSYRHIEVIIVDDNDANSNDRFLTEEIVSEYTEIDLRVRYIKHTKNLNGAVARNTGAAASCGDYLSFLDSDDEYHVNRLEKFVRLIDQVGDTFGGIYSGCEFRRRGKIYKRFDKVQSGSFLVETLAGTFKFMSGSNLFVKKSIYLELGGFDEEFLRHQDYEFLVRFFQNYSLYGLSESLIIKNNENLNLPSHEIMYQVKKQYLEKYEPIINSLDVQDRNYIFKSHYISLAEQAMRSGDRNNAKMFYYLAKKYKNLTFKQSFRKVILSILLSLKR